jgi:hypothetical protein
MFGKAVGRGAVDVVVWTLFTGITCFGLVHNNPLLGPFGPHSTLLRVCITRLLGNVAFTFFQL